MLGRGYEGQNCSIARTLEVVGERWTLVILREVLMGHRRFDQMAGRIGIARNVLTTRLNGLVADGILEKVAYQERPERFEYRLTDMGLDLWPVIVALLQFGDRHLAPNGPPVVLRHKGCGGEPDTHRVCDRCGERLTARAVTAEPGPGALTPA
jgi:DNA-binding HxlR family transcriptional regulator